MTYSFLAVNRDSGAIAIATASRALAVGNAVPAIRPGVGAVVSQAYTNAALRGHVLQSLGAGFSPKQTLADLQFVDEDLRVRQVGALGPTGTSAAHTGAGCSDWAGHRSGDGVLAIGNLLTGPEVLEAMVSCAAGRALGGSATNLAEVMLASMRAGLRAGGDRRGQQSAALIVAEGQDEGLCPPSLAMDLRVDDHAHPLDELQRLLHLATTGAQVTVRTD